MNGRFPKNAASGEERAVDDQNVGKERQDKVRPDKTAVPHLHDQSMQQRDGDNPRYQGGIFDRVPTPPSSPSQHSVRPVAAEHDPGAKRDDGKQDPRERNASPVRKRSPPKSRNRQGKRNGQRGESDEQDRRMNRHPHILEKRIK